MFELPEILCMIFCIFVLFFLFYNTYKEKKEFQLEKVYLSISLEAAKLEKMKSEMEDGWLLVHSKKEISYEL